MKINELITEVADLKPNQFDDAQLKRWISAIEGKIMNDIINTHELDERLIDFTFTKYDENTNADTELVVPEPYTDLYKYYLFSMIDFTNEETDRYQNSALMFNNSYQEFANYWNRTHRSKGPNRFQV